VNWELGISEKFISVGKEYSNKLIGYEEIENSFIMVNSWFFLI
jgi:hypothetical protein